MKKLKGELDLPKKIKGKKDQGSGYQDIIKKYIDENGRRKSPIFGASGIDGAATPSTYCESARTDLFRRALSSYTHFFPPARANEAACFHFFPRLQKNAPEIPGSRTSGLSVFKKKPERERGLRRRSRKSLISSKKLTLACKNINY